MNKSKIPVPSKKLAVSSIPKPVKVKKNVSEKENKPQIRLPTRLQASNIKSNQFVAKPLSTSNPISKIGVEKASKKVPSNLERIKNLSSCPKVKLIKVEKPLPKIQKISQKPLKKPTKPASTNVAQRLPSNSNISNLQDKSKKECHPKIISRTKNTAQKPQNIRCNLKNSDPVVDKVHRTVTKENVKANSPVRLKEAESNLDKNDIEFQASDFYKKLILDQRELSPGIIKLCASKNISSIVAHIDSPGMMLQMKNTPADFLVEDLKRNSAMFHRFKGKLQFSPCLAHKDSPFKRTPYRLLSAKKNFGNHDLATVRRGSELRNKVLEKNSHLGISNQNFRRWTTNIPQKSEVTSDEARRFSEMRKESIFPISNKSSSHIGYHQLKGLNPHEKVLRELKSLAIKKKEKSKKKVTFHIPKTSPTNKISKEATSNNLESGLSTVFESSSKNSTPELNSNLCKNSANDLKPKDCRESSENPSQVTTPELHLNSCRTNASLFSSGNECDNKQNCETEVTTPEFDLKTPHCLSEYHIQNPQFCTNKVSLVSAPLDAHFSKLQISSCLSDDKNVISNVSPKILYSLPECVLSQKPGSSSSKDTTYMPTTCLIESMENIAVTSLQQQFNHPKEYCASSGKQIFTPRPVSLYSNSKLSSSISPIFLTGKSAGICSYVPIYTPYALKNLAEDEESIPIRQKLQFNDACEISNERRESQIYIQNIPTLQKTYDYLCDQECSIFSSQSSTMEFTRNLKDPVASILSEGDQMHFLPLRRLS